MWWHDHRSTVARFGGLAAALALSTLLAGCFEPLYGEKTLAGARKRLGRTTTPVPAVVPERERARHAAPVADAEA